MAPYQGTYSAAADGSRFTCHRNSRTLFLLPMPCRAFNERGPGAGYALPASRRKVAVDPAHIIIIDRDPVLLSLMEELLRDEQFQVTTSSDGGSAHALIAERRPALVLLDIHLEQPGQGIALLGELTADPRTSRIPVLICSADAEFLQRHADTLPTRGYPIIEKPFDIDAMIHAIRSQIGFVPVHAA